MKLLILIIFLSTYTCLTQAQETWSLFSDTLSGLSGYKNAEGKVMISPRFRSTSGNFDKIIAVVEDINKKYRNYFLLKDGRELGLDSVYILNFFPTSLSEGKINFEDRKKNAVGVLNEKGEVIIPAIYDHIEPFKNGIAVAYRNGTYLCPDGSKNFSECEHASWHGSETVLINDKNEILAEGITTDLPTVDWYSMRLNLEHPDTSLYITIEGNNNTTYSFIDFEKEFKKWFENVFLPGIQKSPINDSLLFEEITFWEKDWKNLPAEQFLKTYPTAISPSRFTASKTTKLNILSTSLNYLIFEKPIYSNYYNYSDETYHRRYPLFEVLISHYKKRAEQVDDFDDDFLNLFEIDYQESFEFLKTEYGYRLLSATIPVE